MLSEALCGKLFGHDFAIGACELADKLSMVEICIIACLGGPKVVAIFLGTLLYLLGRGSRTPSLCL